MTPTELTELRAMSEWILRPSFYVEARVGSENHRGQCCRALMNDARRNERADELLKRFARAFLAAPPPLAWTDAKPTVPGLFLWRYDSTSPPDDYETIEAVRHERLGMSRRRGKGLFSFSHGEYFGPIPLPVEESR